MPDPKYILAIDQGTTSTKALVLDNTGRIVGVSKGQFGIDGIYPEPGWVEYEPEQIWRSVRESTAAAIDDASLKAEEIAAIGLANQGETVIAFDAEDGTPVGNAISWQDRRTEDIVAGWRASGLEQEIFKQSGLRLDPYFSAPKMKWILENEAEAERLHRLGRLRLGTSDAWLGWQLTGGRSFVTDAATASRTMLLNLSDIAWSKDLLPAFGLPEEALPKIVPNTGSIGLSIKDLVGREVPVTGLCVDQHAALFGHGCFEAKQAKATYGTGCFLLTNVGADPTLRADGLLTALGWQIDGKATYVMEGGVYSAGSIVEWLIKLGLISDASELDSLALAVDDTGGVILIPAFSGLAAPYWKSRARACWAGMGSGTEREHLVRAVLEAIAYRVRDIHGSMAAAGIELGELRVDGGLTRSDFLMQYQADVLVCPVAVSESPEVTALGVGLMAGVGIGLWEYRTGMPKVAEIARRFEPQPDNTSQCRKSYESWHRICLEVAEWGDG